MRHLKKTSSDIQPRILRRRGPDGLRHISCNSVVPPVGCRDTKTEQTSSTSKSNCKTNLRKADEPSSLSQPSPSLKTLQIPSPLLNCPGRNPTASRQLLPCIGIPDAPHRPCLRSCSSQPHPAFCGYLLSYTFPQTLCSATSPQHK